jgi:hypothetical protein
VDIDCVLHKVRNGAVETFERRSYNAAYHNKMAVPWTKIKLEFSKNKGIADTRA